MHALRQHGNFRCTAVFLAAAAFLPLAAHAQTGCLTGNVVDYTSVPVPGVRIAVGDGSWSSALLAPVIESDESWQFRIDGIPPGNYNADASNDQLGYPGIWRPEEKVSINSSSICANIAFNLGARAAKLKFTVTDAATNQPIKNIVYIVFPEGKPSLRLSVEPLLSNGVPPQVPSLTKLRIEVTAKGYSSSEFAFASLAPGATQQIVTTLSPKRMGCITGIAIDDNFAPVAEANISAGFMGNAPSPATTDSSGRFTLDNLQPGTYTLYPEKDSDGFPGLWSGWQGQVALQKVSVTPGGACQEVTINMGARGAVLRVRAMDALTHEPLTNIMVGFRNPQNPRQGGSIIGQPHEPHEVQIPSRSNVDIQVRAQGYQSSEQIHVGPLAPGEVQDLTVSLQRENASPSNANQTK